MSTNEHSVLSTQTCCSAVTRALVGFWWACSSLWPSLQLLILI